MREVLPVKISLKQTSNRNVRLFPKPARSTASRLAFVCSGHNSRNILNWDNHRRAFSRAESKVYFEAAILLLSKLPSRMCKHKESILWQLIGRHQSTRTTPHQSETLFAHKRSFPKEQWLQAGVFFFSPSLPPSFPFRLIPSVWLLFLLSLIFLFFLNPRWRL